MRAHLVFLSMLLAGPVLAEDDQTRARAALERREARSLAEVLEAGRDAVPGDVVAIEFKQTGDRWIYELKILTPTGLRREVEIDARTLTVIEIEVED